ncbi:MAG: hypothetical protein PHP08_01980 [Candidatus Dojkabacteria bacterium]|nr:hypothetical protein [Candidatus Dojkabacteria bacterium]
MSDTYNRYYGPGSNIWPAFRYLKSKKATSPAKAISLDQIESEDFKQLLRLNSQTSFWIVVTPEGRYWVRTGFLYISYGLFAIVFIGIALLMLSIFAKMDLPDSGFFNFNSTKQEIEEQADEIKQNIEETKQKIDNN